MARRQSLFLTREDLDEDDEDETSDDEDSLLNENINNEGSELRKWDVFQDLPPEEESSSTMEHKWIEVSMKVMKFLSYILSFFMVLGCGIIAKGCILFMTSQLKPGRVTEFCNRELGREKHFTSVIPEEERIAWTWSLLIAIAVPELGAFIRSFRICIFKFWKKPPFWDFMVVAAMETFHAIGVSLLIFCILPNLDVIRGAMLTNCVCFIPGVLQLLCRNEDNQEEYSELKSGENEVANRWAYNAKAFNEDVGNKQQSKPLIVRLKELSFKGWRLIILDVLAIVAQGTGFVLWPLSEGGSKPQLWAIPFALLFISAGWWENFVSTNSPITIVSSIGKIKERLKDTRYFIYSVVSMWKILVIFVVCLFCQYANGQNVLNFFKRASEGFHSHKVTVEEVKTIYSDSNGIGADISDAVPVGESIQVDVSYQAPICVFTLQILSAYLCYVFGKFACKICIQEFSFAFPLNLTVPVTIILLIAMCVERAKDACAYYGALPDYLFFDSPSIYLIQDFVFGQHVWLWLFWLLSQAWITLHIWNPKHDRVASTEKLFVNPTYSGALTDQSIALNRRQYDEREIDDEDDDNLEQSNLNMNSADSTIKRSDTIPHIFACATMWHETKEEMKEMLKSIMRLDSDQSARHNVQQYFRLPDPDYYKLEVHIFFDDAFTINEDDEKVVNQFVKYLVETIDDAATHVHEAHIKIRSPKKYPTPYGGRLVWTLPGKTKMFAHLKDKTRIRQKKRWSQVMYMYYLLGHRLMDRPIDAKRKELRAENTFILALDGDIDFQPNAVQLLVDLMKKNRNLGAACGRIHPVGTGPMVWYQMFEYAVGHWLQKATEHTIGSVLCSPGCFSLFRGKALMDDNVMRKYTTRSNEARHYVQYDQGEDRWLCTLLLQRGHHVEYSAASDAYTHCPEGFNEFYNQRRRWVPSTMANIFDLLGDFSRTVENNANISTLYIVYQMVLMAGTILGPGTIFLMLVGAFVAAFKIDNWTSFYYNLIPILIYMVVCFLCESKVQLWVALVISTVYGLVMIAVLVGIMMQIAEDGPLAPSSLFLFVVASEFIVTAILHPKEIGCLPHGITYYITVPSMYLLLIIYSVFNLNNVSWGTREIISEKRKKEIEEEMKRKAEEAKKSGKTKSFLGFLGPAGANDQSGSFELSFAGLFKCMMCTHKDEKKAEEKELLLKISDSLESLGKRLDGMERIIDPRGMNSGRRRSVISTAPPSFLNTLQEKEDESKDDDQESDNSDSGSTVSEPKIERDDLINPYWIEDPALKNGERSILSTDEQIFWKELIDKYLYPIAESDEEKKKIAEDLKHLRDKSVFAFFMLNAFFVVIVFLLQLHKDLLHINWPLGVKNNITFVEKNNVIAINKKYLELEPIGLVFVFFFGLILVIQFVAMLVHRLGTLSHILASTELGCYCAKKLEDVSNDVMTVGEAYIFSRQIQKLAGIDEDNKQRKNSRVDRHQVGRRKTAIRLDNINKPQRHINTLDEAFRTRINSLKPETFGSTDLGKKLSMRRGTLMGLQRAKSIVREENERRKSSIGALGLSRRSRAGGGSSISDVSNASDDRSFSGTFTNGERITNVASPITNKTKGPASRKSVQFKVSTDNEISDV